MKRFDAFIGGSYESRAVNADCERTINCFVEDLQSKNATSPRTLLPTPGVEVITTVTADNPGRAHFAINGREFAVIGGAFYEFGLDGTVLNSSANDLTGPLATPTLINTSLPATISCNGDGGGQLFITAGGNGYIYDLNTHPSVTVPVFINALEGIAQFGAHLDGYFVALDTVNSKLYVSALYDGLTWDVGGTFAQRSLGPDKWKSMKVAGRAVWLFGEQTTEVWYNTGDRFPLSPLANQLIGYGIAAPFSAETVGSDICWLSINRDGKVCVMKASGMQPEVISTYPLDMAMQSYRSLTNAVSDAYSDAGHTFFMLNFDNDNITWCWDSITGLWHERGTWLPEEHRYTSWRPRFYAYAFGEHRMLDSANGNLYRMSSDLTRDVDGRQIRSARRAPAIMDGTSRVFYPAFALDIEGSAVDQGHVSFTMVAERSFISGTVTDDGGDVVEGGEVTITVDDVPWEEEITTDEEGHFEVHDLPTGTVVISVHSYDGITPLCGSVTIDNDPALDVETDILIAPWEPNWCVDDEEDGPNFNVTLTPLIDVACTQSIEYLWTVWNNATSEEAPWNTYTDASPAFVMTNSEHEGGHAKLRITDTVTGWTHTTGAFTFAETQC